MHCTKIDNHPHYKSIRIHHHGDWCGDAEVIATTHDGVQLEFELPADLLVALSAAAASTVLRNYMIEAIENWPGARVGGP